MKCIRCGSYAINHNLHDRDGTHEELCDVCFWRLKYENLLEYNKQKSICTNCTHKDDCIGYVPIGKTGFITCENYKCEGLK